MCLSTRRFRARPAGIARDPEYDISILRFSMFVFFLLVSLKFLFFFEQGVARSSLVEMRSANQASSDAGCGFGSQTNLIFGIAHKNKTISQKSNIKQKHASKKNLHRLKNRFSVDIFLRNVFNS